MSAHSGDSVRDATGPRVHQLKTWSVPFFAVAAGSKRHEIRVNDRDFERGDQLLLQHFDPKQNEYIGGWILVRVSYITRGGEWGLPANLAVMSIEVIDKWVP